MTGPEHTSHARREVQLPAVVEVVALVALAVLVAVLEVLFLPVHLGTLSVPVGAIAAAVTNPVLVAAAGERTTRTTVAAAPLGAWVLTVLLLTFPGPGGDVLLLNDWRALVLLVLGVVPAALLLGRHVGRAAVQRAQSTR
ncbi:hypothetical protein RHODO2019_12415 [Rhodococcus antarcticus]|uniref:Uncharacterized protein n=1 Tax=Rhodococcus antarcticus TaxID=2987751 RepID=A0ABY6NYB3_9NOCA|nr:hypothetical protein [Rhodococcus antarcticus]UZJ23983.1 hypothetical protein RHODO2019_12415 [Rhodococcus antarcticus]